METRRYGCIIIVFHLAECGIRSGCMCTRSGCMCTRSGFMWNMIWPYILLSSVEKFPVVIRLVISLPIKSMAWIAIQKKNAWRLSKIYDEFERISLPRKLNTVTCMIKLYMVWSLYSFCMLHEIRLILYFGLWHSSQTEYFFIIYWDLILCSTSWIISLVVYENWSYNVRDNCKL